eukprot:GHVN01063556.1.p2 GENE.GHVN01063556.1~~GHVN01063556.1.p2  ORF type:complete len:120 (+),score=2.29 GHVN01063556.1:78-437(+)
MCGVGGVVTAFLAGLFYLYNERRGRLQYCAHRVRVRRGDRKKKVAKGIVHGNPSNSGIHQMKSRRSLRSVAEERVGRKICGGLRVLNTYWVGQDALCKYYEIILVDPMHNRIRNDPRIN